MTKIVFILGSLHMQRCMKRIDEFVEQGYKVDAYGFDRAIEARKKPQAVIIESIGKIDNSIGYIHRIGAIRRGIKSVVDRYKGQNVIYYAFGLEIAFITSHLSKQPYIYEESDLVHTYMKPQLMVSLFEWIDKRVIKKSLLSVFTSDGFLTYHFGKRRPDNTIVIANRLPLSVEKLPKVQKKTFDAAHLAIGFVGFIRFNSIFNFAKVVCESFPNVTFHFFGTANNDADEKLFHPLHQYTNCIFHGAFKHPDDLPSVYSQLDLVLSTYDVENENVRYAEPNKIYEAIYFKTPIIVSSGTYLAEKVRQLGIGFDIDPMNDEAVRAFVGTLKEDLLRKVGKRLEMTDKKIALNNNDIFFGILTLVSKEI